MDDDERHQLDSAIEGLVVINPELKGALDAEDVKQNLV